MILFLNVINNEEISQETQDFINSITMIDLGYGWNQLDDYKTIEVNSNKTFYLNSLYTNKDLSIAPEKIINIWDINGALDLSGYSMFYDYSY